MKLAGMLLKLLNMIVSQMIVLILLAAAAWAGYSIWDNTQITRDIREVQRSVRELRPVSDSEEGNGPDFRDLQERNPDICAWLILQDTDIDDPIVQGENNKKYMNTDVYGNYNFAGSLFLDSRNSRTFEDDVHVLYGHNVDNPLGKSDDRMFACLLNYRDAAYFEEHRDGSLLIPGKEWSLRVFACLQTDAREELFFNPAYAAENRSELLEYTEERAEQADREVLAAMQDSREKLLVMTTCTLDGILDSRTVVLARMEETA